MVSIGKLYSEEQIERAKNINLVDYLMYRGETLKRAGSEYKYIYIDSSGEHDSVTVRNNKWYDHKNQRGGDTIGFLQEFMGLSFREAVEQLLNGEQGNDYSKVNQYNLNIELQQKEKDFVLPEPGKNMYKLFAYLVKSRFISPSVVQHFVKAKVIYQEKKHGNVVFLGLDKEGVALSAQEVGTNTYKPKFKSSISGSDMKYAFNHKGKGNNLFVFESPIDLMSYITIYPENWKEHNYIALDGLSPRAIFLFLEENTNIDFINICVDYDEAGIEAYDKFKDMLIEKGYKNENIKRIYPIYKDWNEMLKAEAGYAAIPAKEHPKIQKYKDIVFFLSDINEKTKNNYIKWRYEQYKKQYINFVLAELRKMFASFQNEIQKEKIVKFKSDDISKPKLHMLRMADFCLATISYMEAEKYSVGNQTKFYKSNLKELLNNYKPYKDKGKFRTRLDEVIKSYQELKNTLKIENDENILKDALKSYADTCIRMNIYIDLSYEIDLSITLNLINRNIQQLAKQNNISMNMV